MTALTLPAPGAEKSGKSRLAARILDDLMALPPEVRRPTLASLAVGDLAQVLAAADDEFGTRFILWRDDPSGFVEQVLGESLWAKQREILHSLTTVKTVAVPAGFGLGKTWLAARAVCWWSCVHPVGTALAVTTATRMRQVHRQMWPHIRHAVAHGGLPGECDQVQYKMADRKGVDVVVAYGFTAVEHDEAAMQGVHGSNLLLIVDEAGGIGPVIGHATKNLLTGSNARMLAIGNPAADAEQTWFEKLCTDGEDPDRPNVVTIQLPATASPAVTGELVDDQVCPCMGGEDGHLVSSHLVDQEWIDEAIRDHGPDSPYVIAKVHARFPKGTADRVIPVAWVEAACEQDEPETGTRLCDLGLAGETAEWKVQPGAWVRLGVDVAADGGDELAISRIVGDLATVEHASSGADNGDFITVAGKVLEQIRRAERLRARLGTAAPVRVKIDGIGVGWGVAGLLEQWRKDGVHGAEIVPVIVSEAPDREPDSAMMRPFRKRDEMWLAGRTLIRPDGEGRCRVRLRVDKKTAAQLSGPKKRENSTGHTLVESKKDMKARRVPSPDRGECVLLGWYEAAPKKPKKRGRLIVG